jgi:para-nitrobenzyl esterase
MANLLWAQDRRLASRRPTYVYVFDHPEPGTSPVFGVFHSAERPYVFGNLIGDGRVFSEKDQRIANMMQSYWVNFVRKGDPNGEGLPSWKPAGAGDDGAMELGDRNAPFPMDRKAAALLRESTQSGFALHVF